MRTVSEHREAHEAFYNSDQISQFNKFDKTWMFMLYDN